VPDPWYGEEAARLRRLALDHDNYRQAIRWALTHGDGATALKLSTALCRFWDVRGHHSEGRAWLAQALAAAPPSDAFARVRVRALQGAGGLAAEQGDLDEAIQLTEASLQLARRTGDRAGRASALLWLGIQTMWRHELDRASYYLQQSLALARQLDDRIGLARALVNLAHVARQQGDFSQAQLWVEQSEPLFRSLYESRQVCK